MAGTGATITQKSVVPSSAPSGCSPASSAVDGADDRIPDFPEATLDRVAVIFAGVVKRSREARAETERRAS